MKQRRPSKCIKKTSWFMLYSGILYINSKISPKNVRYKRSTKVARARKVVERSLLSSKGPEAPVLHEGRARARARAKYPEIFTRFLHLLQCQLLELPKSCCGQNNSSSASVVGPEEEREPLGFRTFFNHHDVVMMMTRSAVLRTLSARVS